MKQARYYHKPGRAKPHEIRFYDPDGKIHSKFFENKLSVKDESGQIVKLGAMDFMDECNSSIRLPEEMQFTITDRMLFSQIKAACEAAGTPIDKAAEIVKLNIENFSQAKGMTFDKAKTAFLADCERRRTRKDTRLFYTRFINDFAKYFKHPDIIAVTRTAAEAYLASHKSPDHAKRALRAFFNYCVSQKWIPISPFYKIKSPKIIKPKKIPPVLSVDNTSLLFSKLEDKWKPLFALMAFAGVRPGELISPNEKPSKSEKSAPRKNGLEIKHIDFKAKRIVIPDTVAKTQDARIILTPPENIWKWLQPLKTRPKEDIYVAPGSYEAYRKQKALSGIDFTNTSLLRHSFGSYAYHFLGVERTIEITGHEYKTFKKHYKGLATPKDSKLYFSITPDSVSAWAKKNTKAISAATNKATSTLTSRKAQKQLSRQKNKK